MNLSGGFANDEFALELRVSESSLTCSLWPKILPLPVAAIH